MQDLRGVITSHQLFANIPEATTITEMVAAARAYFVLLDPLTDAAGLLGHIQFTFDPTGLKTAPTTPGNNFNDNGLFSFAQSNLPYKQGILVPAYAASEIANGKITVDPDLTAWVTWLKAGSANLPIVSKSGNPLVEPFRIKLVTRKHRKQESAISTEVD
jgi:hypothetical protein